MVIELMEGSLHGHLKEKYNTYKKICESKATSAEETGFMFVPINVMTNWLRKEFDSNILYCDTSYSILHPYPWFTRNRPILRSFIIESNGPGRNIIYLKKLWKSCIASAMVYVQSRGVVHRDLRKVEN